MKRWLPLMVAVFAMAGYALAQRTTADQGRPGREGPWPVTGTLAVVGPDGGAVRVIGPIAVVGTDGGPVQVQPNFLIPTTTISRLADCAAAGTTTVWVDAGTYRITGSDEQARLCWAATTCTSTTGDVIPVAAIEYRLLPAQNLACYSASGTADIDLTLQTR